MRLRLKKKMRLGKKFNKFSCWIKPSKDSPTWMYSCLSIRKDGRKFAEKLRNMTILILLKHKKWIKASRIQSKAHASSISLWLVDSKETNLSQSKRCFLNSPWVNFKNKPKRRKRTWGTTMKWRRPSGLKKRKQKKKKSLKNDIFFH